jgi:hypothetical protein
MDEFWFSRTKLLEYSRNNSVREKVSLYESTNDLPIGHVSITPKVNSLEVPLPQVAGNHSCPDLRDS